MEHVLDNPAWNALLSGNSDLAIGNDAVKFFDYNVSPFAGMREYAGENFIKLYQLISHENPIILVSSVKIEGIPSSWQVLNCIRGLQMVYKDSNTVVDYDSSYIQPLTTDDVSQMLALTKLTNPGPFNTQTINFGHYRGIFEGEQLAAMAGQRLNPFSYAEISAVCTHPDHTGKGHAKDLILNQVIRMIAAGEIPYLHVREDNERAIKLYEHIGFETRTEVYFHVLLKTKP